MTVPPIKNVTVAGSGVLGAQIAFQTAYYGFKVVVYDLNEEVLEKAKTRLQSLQPKYIADLGASQTQVQEAYSRVSYSVSLSEAVRNADLVIESIPEDLKIKQSFYEQLAKVAPSATIFASNSSSLLPSQFAEFTGRPERFLNLHFANEIWKHNIAEIMGHPGTDSSVFTTVVEFAKNIGMVPLLLHKEQPAYLLNSLLIPLLNAAMGLLVNEVADAQTIDKAWMIGTGAPKGPFAILDIIGITTAYNISKNTVAQTGDPKVARNVEFYKKNFIDTGKLGAATGEGFYKYPNPEYLRPDFLK